MWNRTRIYILVKVIMIKLIKVNYKVQRPQLKLIAVQLNFKEKLH